MRNNNVSFELIAQGANIRPQNGAFGFSTSVLIHDGDNHILFDTGSFGIRDKVKCLLDNKKVTSLVISHLHFDHCSNIDLFIDIPIYVSESELKSLDKTEDINTYSPLKYFKDRLNFLFLSNGMNVLPNVTAIHTPGHTAGHFSLSFNNDDKRIIVAGDAVKSAKEYKTREQIVPPMDIFAHKTTMEFIKNSFDIIIPGHQGPFIVDEPIDKDIILSYF